MVDVLRFDAGPSGTVVFEGSWTVLAAGSDQPLLTRAVRLRANVRARSFHSEAAAMSRLLGRLADRIAALLERRPARTGCAAAALRTSCN